MTPERSLLVLGGTAWLGGEVARAAMADGWSVTCLARGEAGPAPDGVEWVRADRREPGAYDPVAAREWDAVVEVSWQPGMVRSAVRALEARARHWTYVSSCSVYADESRPGMDETAEVLPPHPGETATLEVYGEAKVACEQASTEAVGDRLLLVRPGLIGGYGDRSDRFGYWPARFAVPAGPRGEVLVPDAADEATQTVDAADLAAWLVASAGSGRTGVFDAVGEVHPLGEVLAAARSAAGHEGPLVPVPSDWLRQRGVEPYMGPESLPLWLDDPAYAGFSRRDGSAAVAAGLRHRPLADLVAAALAWERELGLDRVRRAGLTPERERELLAAWAGRG